MPVRCLLCSALRAPPVASIAGSSGSVRKDGKARARAYRRDCVGNRAQLGRTVRSDDPSDEVVISRLLDRDLDDLSRPRGAPVDVDLAVDLGRLSHPAAFEQQRSLLGDALHQHVERLADQRCLVRLADLPLDAEELLLPLRLHSRGKLSVEVVGGRSLFARELEDADALEAHLLDELAQLLELRIRLTGEPDDEAGAEDEI